jgi:acetyl-CoA carboxylase biotin carboxyl carrier protein
MPEVEAEVTGNVWKMQVAVGDTVDEGDVLMILESMKVEVPVETEVSGTVKELRVQEGQAIEEGDVVAVVE